MIDRPLWNRGYKVYRLQNTYVLDQHETLQIFTNLRKMLVTPFSRPSVNAFAGEVDPVWIVDA